MKKYFGKLTRFSAEVLPKLVAVTLSLAVIMLGGTVLVKEDEALVSAFESASLVSLGLGTACGTVYAILGIYAGLSDISFKRECETQREEPNTERVLTDEELEKSTIEINEQETVTPTDTNDTKESEDMNTTNFYDVAFRYFTTTIGRYYTYEQKERLLRLFLESEGIATGTEEYTAMMRAVSEAESENITDIVDAKNYKLFSDVMQKGEADDIVSDALVNAFVALSERGVVHKTSLEWIVSMRTGSGQDREELAYYEWSCGNVPSSIIEFKSLMSRGSIRAIQCLAAINYSIEDVPEAYYHYALLDEIIRDELKSEVPEYIGTRTSELVTKLTPEQKAQIDLRIRGVIPFLGGKKNTIGFLAQ